MQRIWTRSAPAAPTAHCISCLSTAAESVILRTPSATNKRRLYFRAPSIASYNSFSGPLTLVDAQGKAKRRNGKSAPVSQEVNELVDEEQHIIEVNFSRRTTNNLRRAPQTRQFHILPQTTYRNVSLPRIQPPSRSLHFFGLAPKVEDDGEIDRSAIKELEAENLALLNDDHADDFDKALDGEQTPEWLTTDIIRAKAIRKLALKQLAIRLLLRPVIAHSYYGVLKNYASDDTLVNLDLANLLFELNAIRRRIRQIKANPNANIEDLVKEVTVRPSKDMVHGATELDREVRQVTKLYLSDQMSLEELLLRLSNNFLHSHDPDRSHALMITIIAFTKSRQNDLAELVIKTILPYKFTLTPSLILAILNFFRKSKDLKGFDLFLQMLEGKGYPVDMGNLGLYESKVVNGITISVPPVDSVNPVIYGSLIQACIRFDQPDRAQAYLLSARAAGVAEDFTVLMAFLKLYTIRHDWKKGRPLLQRAVAWIAGTTEHSMQRVERLVVLMVRLCDACHQFELSDALIRAAVGSGFDWKIAENQKDIVFEFDPELKRWETAAQDLTVRSGPQPIPWFVYHKFAQSARKLLSEAATLNGGPYLDQLENLSKDYSSLRLTTALDELQSRGLNAPQEQPSQPDNASPETLAEPATGDPSTPSNPEQQVTESRQSDLEQQLAERRQEIGSLKYELFELKQMVQKFSQPRSPPGYRPDWRTRNDVAYLKQTVSRLSRTRFPPPRNAPPSARDRQMIYDVTQLKQMVYKLYRDNEAADRASGGYGTRNRDQAASDEDMLRGGNDNASVADKLALYSDKAV
ncbi:hypothetical protein BDV12DRAFT_134849 [Aspergillus spectabilis]